MAFILWPDVNENLRLVLSWRQQSAGFTPLQHSELPQILKTADDLMDSAPSSRGSLVTVITCSKPSVSAVFLLPSSRYLSASFRRGSHLSGLCGRVMDLQPNLSRKPRQRSPGTDPCWAPWTHVCSLTKFDSHKFAYLDEAMMTPETSRSDNSEKRYITWRTKEPKQRSN